MTTQFLKKTMIAAALALAFTGAQAANTMISNGGTVAAINDAGTFTSFVEPGGFSPLGEPGLSHNAAEYVNWGTPISWNWLKAGASDSPSFLGSNPRAGVTGPAVGGGTITNSFSMAGLNVLQTFSILTPGTLTVSVSITNDSGSAVSGVWWGVGFDPDQGVGFGLGNATRNRILGQANDAAVSAVDSGGNASIILRNDTTSGAFDVRAFIDVTTCCVAVDPSLAFAGAQAPGFSTFDDDSISLAYRIGGLGAGEVATLGYSYVMTAVPEPETYAMMLAGLGLMGFVARRRQRKLV